MQHEKYYMSHTFFACFECMLYLYIYYYYCYYFLYYYSYFLNSSYIIMIFIMYYLLIDHLKIQYDNLYSFVVLLILIILYTDYVGHYYD
jgi:hypothetical protein